MLWICCINSSHICARVWMCVYSERRATTFLRKLHWLAGKTLCMCAFVHQLLMRHGTGILVLRAIIHCIPYRRTQRQQQYGTTIHIYANFMFIRIPTMFLECIVQMCIFVCAWVCVPPALARYVCWAGHNFPSSRRYRIPSAAETYTSIQCRTMISWFAFDSFCCLFFFLMFRSDFAE